MKEERRNIKQKKTEKRVISFPYKLQLFSHLPFLYTFHILALFSFRFTQKECCGWLE
jgi:hypothetical protein